MLKLIYKVVNRQFSVSKRCYGSMRTRRRGSNILLMGSPGCGKTTIAKRLAQELDMPVIDIDDDVLERQWSMPVSKKLFQVGGPQFLKEEASAFLSFKAEHSIISMTGSQPLNAEAMEHARKLGLVVYLDMDSGDILERLNLMKVDRIVGQEAGIDMKTILAYRQSFYENNYDLRVICEKKESVEGIANKVLKVINRHVNDKGFVSTRSRGCSQSFLDVTLQGLAPDRGLFVSNAEVPKLTIGQWARLVGSSYTECALKILEQWVPTSEIPPKDLKELIRQAYSEQNFSHADIAPTVFLEQKQYLLELFHGPTASFKDLALQLTPKLFDYASERQPSGSRYLILVATSGDTGGAVLNGFCRNSDCSEVVVLFPENGISSIQKAQLTSLPSSKAHVIGVEDDFDFCQTSIKNIFTDTQYCQRIQSEFGYMLSAGNSINFARLLPQVVYHAWSYLVMVRDNHISMGDKVDIAVPTGNFGNILGAYYAKKMGLPIRNMIIASNSNNVLNEFFTTGVYDICNRQLIQTSAPSIDILKSSNLERYLYSASGNNHKLICNLFTSLDMTGRFNIDRDTKFFEKIQQDFKSDFCSDEECIKSIKETFKRTGYMIDPHTAVAKAVVDKMKLGTDVPVIISSTAHFAKFSSAILGAIGVTCPSNNPADIMHTALELTSKPQKHVALWNDVLQPRFHKKVCKGKESAIRGTLDDLLYDMCKKRRNSNKPSPS